MLLLCTPIIDLVLLAAAAVDLRNGAAANASHGLAAVYLGVSIAFGHSMIKWADAQFSYRFAGGPAPVSPPKWGKAHARRERSGWFRHLLAWAIGCGIIYILMWAAGDGGRTEALLGVMRVWSIVLAIDFIVSFSYTLWPKPEKKERGM